MKPLKVLSIILACFYSMVHPSHLLGQCTSLTMKSVLYDTLVTGSGNDNYGFTVPQFNPSSGTLISAVIKTNVSVGYAFQAENTTNSSRSVSIGVGRYDYLTGSTLSNSNYASGTQKTYGPYTLGKSDGVSGSGTDYISKGPFSFLSNTVIINDSITTSVTGFLGYGTISFGYYPSTYSTIPQNLTYTFEAADTIHFSVTYYYCNTSALPTGITNFFATKQKDAAIKLSWTTENEQQGKTYEIESSVNGINFDSVGVVISNTTDIQSSYNYVYHIRNSDKGRIFFRLKETNPDGSMSYSEIRAVDLDDNDQSGMMIFPNPANDHINVVLGQSATGNWQVDIFAAHGALIQRKLVSGSNAAEIYFTTKPASGVYFIRATNVQTLEHHISSFVIQ